MSAPRPTYRRGLRIIHKWVIHVDRGIGSFLLTAYGTVLCIIHAWMIHDVCWGVYSWVIQNICAGGEVGNLNAAGSTGVPGS